MSVTGRPETRLGEIMKTEIAKVAESLYLVCQPLKKSETCTQKTVDILVNHIIVIDCSGSMSSDLPRVREQLKKKLQIMLREKDTISIIWFSGRGQFGTLIEAEPVATLADLNDINTAIDRWLKPVGMTGFKEPIEEVSRVVDRVSKKNSGVFSLFFMSDGFDNQWPKKDILEVIGKVSGGLSSATFVEYGYYADRQLLTDMAQKMGGSLIFSEDFDKYAPVFEEAMAKRVSGAPRIELKVNDDVIGGFAYALVDGSLVTFEVTNGLVLVPEDLLEIWYVTGSSKSVDIN